MHPTHDLGAGWFTWFAFYSRHLFANVSQIWGGSTEAWAVMMLPRRMGRDGKLGASTLLQPEALRCKCGCYLAISYNGSLSKPDPRTPVLMTCFCLTFSRLHKDFMGAKISFAVSFHKFYCISGFPLSLFFYRFLDYCHQILPSAKRRRQRKDDVECTKNFEYIEKGIWNVI